MVECRQKKVWKRVWTLAVALAASAGLILLALSVIRTARTAARRAQRRNDLKQIGLAFQNFHDIYKRFPPAVRTDELGRPLCSWRFQLLPYLEACMLDWDWDKAWDDPANRHLSQGGVPCYSLDYDRARVSGNTNVVVITGPGTLFDGQRVCRATDIDADTVLAIEVAAFDRHWMEPGDLSLDEVSETITKGLDGEGVGDAVGGEGFGDLRVGAEFNEGGGCRGIHRRGHLAQLYRAALASLSAP